MRKEEGFGKCCAEEIQRIWYEHGGSMNIVHYETKCPKCGHYIGITQTSKEEADKFLEKFGLKPIAIDTYIKLKDGTDYRVFQKA